MNKDPVFDKSTNTGIRHLVNATRFSIQGLRAAFKNEAAFRQELAYMLLLIPVGIWLSPSTTEALMLMLVTLLVLVVELLNSAVEAAIDRIGTEHHNLSGLAKDYGSAAVMLTLIMAGLTWSAFIFSKLTTE